jgi:hypothetical protein
MKHTLIKTFAFVAITLLLSSLGGCKKEENNVPSTDEIVINLQPGLIHIGTQWVDGILWVESFDPITNSCLLRQYDEQGKVAAGSTKVRLRACRIRQNSDQQTKAPAAKQ